VKLPRQAIKRYAWIAIPVGILAIAGIVAVVILQRGSAATISELPTQVVACQAETSSDFNCWQNRYQAMVNSESPEAAFADFKTVYDVNPYIKSNCHQIGHVIGRASALKYPTLSEAYKHGDEFCWSGYYHGAIEAVATYFAGSPGVSNPP
jgi:hypothetical protein